MELKSYSQLGQDIAVANFFNQKQGGYFVDVGAWDGVEISNTYLLEKQLGWNGICIGPLPKQFESLQKNRACACIQLAAYSQSGLEFDFAVYEGISGIVNHIDKHLHALDGGRIKVHTKTLTEILDENKAPSFIEYMSLDTEGSELEVLKGVDWSRYSFGYISIEHNGVEPRRSQMRQYLQERGYSFLRENGVDDDYVLRLR